MDGLQVISAGALAALILEGIKWLVRLLLKNACYEFPTKFYVVMIPILSFAVQPLLAWLGLGAYIIPANWGEWAKELVVVALSSLTALITYQAGIRGLSEKAQKSLQPPRTYKYP